MYKINRRANTHWVSVLNQANGKYMRLAGFRTRKLAEDYINRLGVKT